MEKKSESRISYVDAPFEESAVRKVLHPLVEKWFFRKFPSFSLPQLYAVMRIHQRENVLVSAPTGATKTLTAFLAVLNELVDSAEKGILEDRTYAVYISPLKALNTDIHFNLIEPLKEIEEIAGKPLGIRVATRTGDTTQSEKSAMLRKPPHILITTPESLGIVLASTKFKDYLQNVDWCIIDEIHALAENKRGVHLSLSMERLQRLSQGMTRVGLSATVAPLEEVARFLVGKRDCRIIDVQFLKNVDFKVISPVDNLIDTPHKRLHSAMYTKIDELVQEHKTTLIFTNTRAATERVVDYLKNRHPEKYTENIGAHHGSLSKEHRLEIEQKLRNGELKCVVCSTSLELGIDIGYVDLVICLGSPKSVARFLQRAGRSGHRLHETVKARVIVMDRDDLVECAVLLKAAIEKKIDRLHIPRNALDVLAQQVQGMSLEGVWEEKDLWETVTSSYCYETLDRKDFSQTLDYLAGKYVDLEQRHIYARIWRMDGRIGSKGRLSRVLHMTNIGTIPDETFITVKIGEQPVGTLDEGFLERLRPGDVFVLGGSTYEFKFARGTVAQVKATTSRPPTVPSWVSEMLPLSFDLAMEIGRFRRLMTEKLKKGRKASLDFINSYLYVDENASNAIYEYFLEQHDYIQKVPTDRKILVEYYTDDRDKKIVFHTLFGRRVNDCLSRAVGLVISKQTLRNVEIGMNDNGFYLGADKKSMAVAALKMLKADKLYMVMDAAIDKSEVMRRRFRHCATRAMMILRNYMGRQKRVGRQQVSSTILMAALRKIDKDFTILKEAKREVLEDLMDIENTKKVLRMLERGDIEVEELETKIPSPFAFKIALQGFMDVLKVEDKFEFLRRMHEMVLAKISLEKGKRTRKGRPAELYEEVWAKEEEYLESKEFQEKMDLKMQLHEASKKFRIPRGAVAELLRLIDGDRDFDDRFFNEFDNHLKPKLPLLPKGLASFLKKARKECDEYVRH